MNQLLFILQEGISGVFRARTSSLLTVLTTAVALTFLGAFFIGSQHLYKIVQDLKARVSLEVFLNDTANNGGAVSVEDKIAAMPGVDSVKFISKEEAMAFFKATFEDAFEDILDENPLPASYQVYLRDTHLTEDSLKTLVAALEAFPQVDEVIYRGKLLRVLNRSLRAIWITTIVLGGALGILSFMLVSNNIRLTLMLRRKIIETMLWVGATRRFVAVPYVIQGMIVGILGAVIAAACLNMVLDGLYYLGGIEISMPAATIPGMAMAGLLFGGTSSMVVLSREI